MLKTELQRIIYKIKTVEHIKFSIITILGIKGVRYEEVIIKLKKTLFAKTLQYFERECRILIRSGYFNNKISLSII